jgi:hypothetical protein
MFSRQCPCSAEVTAFSGDNSDRADVVLASCAESGSPEQNAANDKKKIVFPKYLYILNWFSLEVRVLRILSKESMPEEK